jgi:hypothetical protein
MRTLWLGLLLIPTMAVAAPKTGEKFPEINGQDITGQPQSTRRYRGEKTLILAMSDRKASEGLRAWWLAAAKRIPPSVQRLTIISLDLPFFVGADAVRSKVREKIPHQTWPDNLLDVRGEMARILGISGAEPWIFAVDGDGKILDQFNGPVTGPGAERIWKALEK